MKLARETCNTIPLAPITRLATALIVSVLFFLLTGFYPASTWGWLAIGVAAFSFLFQRFFLLGLALGVLAVWLNAPLPYTQTFSDCTYRATIIRPNYSRSTHNSVIRFSARDIVCDGSTLPSQKLQLWDSRRQFDGLQNKQFVMRSELHPIRARLNFDEFDYEQYLIAEGVRLTIKKPVIVRSVPLQRPLIRLRNAFASAIRTNLSPHNAAIVMALVTGNRSAMSTRQKQVMQQTGTSHILAISGLHIALLGGVAWIIGQWLWACSWRLSDAVMPIQAGAVCALCVITIYAVITGFDVPEKRAWLMFSLIILSWLFVQSLSAHSLLLAAVAVVLVEPYSLVSVGFYFSFIATYIVLWCVRLPFSALGQVLCMQLLINVTLMPIAWFTFDSISLAAFFVNVMIIPWLGLWVLPWAVLACVISLATPTLSLPLWLLVDFASSALWSCIEFFHQLQWSFSPRTTPTLVAVVVAVSSVVLALRYQKYWLALGFFTIFIPFRSPSTPTLTVADGRYTSMLIDNGKTAVLINSGRKYHHINEARKWFRTLQKRGLTLGAIVLQNDKLSNISATQWLASQYPNVRIIALEKFPTPFPQKYCETFTTEGLSLETNKHDGICTATIVWQGESIILFDEKQNDASGNILLNKSRLRWQGKTYETKQLGAIRLTQKNNQWEITTARDKKRLWRTPIPKVSVSD